jgi:hypothetical protein
MKNRTVNTVKYELRLTKQEENTILQTAKKANLSPGDFLKTAVFEKMFLDIVKKDNEKPCFSNTKEM